MIKITRVGELNLKNTGKIEDIIIEPGSLFATVFLQNDKVVVAKKETLNEMLHQIKKQNLNVVGAKIEYKTDKSGVVQDFHIIKAPIPLNSS